MNTKCKVKVNKLGEMINALLIRVTINKSLYDDVYQLREKYNQLCVLIKRDKSVSHKQAGFFKARIFEGSWPKRNKQT